MEAAAVAAEPVQQAVSVAQAALVQAALLVQAVQAGRRPGRPGAMVVPERWLPAAAAVAGVRTG